MTRVEELITAQLDSQDQIAYRLTSFIKLAKPKRTRAALENRLADVARLWEECRKRHLDILNLADDAFRKTHKYFLEQVFGSITDTMDETRDSLQEHLTAMQPRDNPTEYTASAGEQKCATVALPTIAIPKFSGDITGWSSFRDIYHSLVGSRGDLSDIQRLHYLKASLQGEAARLLANTPVAEANYTEALALLTERYERKRAILYSHLQRVVDCPRVTAGSVRELKALLDLSREVRAAFIAESREAGLGEDTFLFLVISKLDKPTRREWELSLGDVNLMPSFTLLADFLKTRIGAWETSEPSLTTELPVRGTKAKGEVTRSHQVCATRHTHTPSNSTALRPTNNYKCVCCGGSHLTYQCHKFLALSVQQRLDLIQRSQRCLNCFSSAHHTNSCTGKYRCRQCQQLHHTLLHLPPRASNGPVPKPVLQPASPTAVSTSSQDSGPSTTNNLSHTVQCHTILPTATVVLTGTSGRSVEVRALLDQGSQSSFISQALVQALKPTIKAVSVRVSGIGASSVGSARHVATLMVRSCSGNKNEESISALVLPKLTAYIPPSVPVTANLSHLFNLPLADRQPFSDTAIDLIIGADYYCHFLREGLIVGPANSPSAQNTAFGWVLSGRFVVASRDSHEVASCHMSVSESEPLNTWLQAFWQVEEVPANVPTSLEDKACEEHFAATYTRLPGGRYSVRLPFRTSPPIPIGDTSSVALRTCLSTEARLERRPDLATSYDSFLREYALLGHMTRVPPGDRRSSSAVYLPHHVVIKESSSTTKARVVFNASCASSNGTSLNDFLHVGPKLQADLFAIILRWRSHRYVYAADLEKMFRQIAVHPTDRDFQRIFWRPRPEDEVQEYRLATVTYGTAPAPYLANRVLRQLVTDEGHKFPLAASILRDDAYVDDLMFGGDDTPSLIQAREQVTELLKAGGFHPYKWASNSETLLADIPRDDLSAAPDKPFGDELPLKVLGIYWNPIRDVFSFKVTSHQGPVTKRTFLSFISRIFDPLGWMTPFLITGKILMQKLWLAKVGWDETLPEDLANSLLIFLSQFTTLNRVVIPRWTHQAGSAPRLSLHGYADASNSAYSAVVYLRVELSSGLVQVSLLYAKTKVAPLKLLSVPRLELCGAELLVRAVNFVQRSMNLGSIPVFCWTDSMTVLSWLQAPASKWKVFVAHRVSKIQNALSSASWRHVPTNDNPADCASRGISAAALLDHSLWWTGPTWLAEPPSEWPQGRVEAGIVAEEECRIRTCANIGIASKSDCEWDLPRRFSSWTRLLRVTCLVKRFICRLRRNSKYTEGPLSAAEVESARLDICRQTQAREFGSLTPTDGKSCIPAALRKYSALSPFVDHDGIVRVGGRLRNAALPFETKHPILIPPGHVANLIARHAHLCTMHGGLRASLYFMRQLYWVVNSRSVMKYHIFRCVTCTRERAQCGRQLLGNLPKARVTPSRPFSHTGVDYAGPFAIRSSKGRGIKTHKAYLVVFVCLATRAVHLEVADDYTTDGFLAAFNRFTARRGIPSDVYSDNGSNFVGADRELSRRLSAVLRDTDLQARFATDGLSWHFIPPAAPHFGGLWEAGVKSTKYHLKRVIGSFTPTYEEFSTLVCKIECVLNSRPIGPLHDDAESLEVLTPGHLLTGAHLLLPPHPSLLDVHENRLGRWQFVRRAAESFWKYWAADYLNSVQQRGKWQDRQPNLAIGDLVLLKSHHLPPTKWDRGRVTECFPGSDGLVRVVSVRTATSLYKRPVTQLCRLPIDTAT